MWVEIIECIILVAGMALGITSAWKKRHAPFDHISIGVLVGFALFAILMAVNLRVHSDALDLVTLILAAPLLAWTWILIWRVFVCKEGTSSDSK